MGPGKPVELVDQHPVAPAGPDIRDQRLQPRPVELGPRMAGIGVDAAQRPAPRRAVGFQPLGLRSDRVALPGLLKGGDPYISVDQHEIPPFPASVYHSKNLRRVCLRRPRGGGIISVERLCVFGRLVSIPSGVGSAGRDFFISGSHLREACPVCGRCSPAPD